MADTNDPTGIGNRKKALENPSWPRYVIKVEEEAPPQPKGYAPRFPFHLIPRGGSATVKNAKLRTCNAARAKFEKEDFPEGRKFTVRAIPGGVRIWRLK